MEAKTAARAAASLPDISSFCAFVLPVVPSEGCASEETVVLYKEECPPFGTALWLFCVFGERVESTGVPIETLPSGIGSGNPDGFGVVFVVADVLVGLGSFVVVTASGVVFEGISGVVVDISGVVVIIEMLGVVSSTSGAEEVVFCGSSSGKYEVVLLPVSLSFFSKEVRSLKEGPCSVASSAFSSAGRILSPIAKAATADTAIGNIKAISNVIAVSLFVFMILNISLLCKALLS